MEQGAVYFNRLQPNAPVHNRQKVHNNERENCQALRSLAISHRLMAGPTGFGQCSFSVLVLPPTRGNTQIVSLLKYSK